MIYLLDTSVLSELAKPRANPNTVKSFTDHFQDVRVASVVIHEVRYGIERLPEGKRKHEVRSKMDQFLATISVLAYDAAAGEWHASERVRLEALGRVPPVADGMIAATAAVHGCTLVTANTRDFTAFQLAVESWA